MRLRSGTRCRWMIAATLAVPGLFLVEPARGAGTRGEIASLREVPFELVIENLERGEGVWGLTESKIRLATLSVLYRHGITPAAESHGYLYLSVNSLAYISSAENWVEAPVGITLGFKRPLMTQPLDPAPWNGVGETWRTAIILMAGKEVFSSYVIRIVEDLVQAFAVDYLTANPKLVRPSPGLPAPAESEAESSIQWKETPTHRIKIKYLGGMEVGRWEFRKR